MERDTGGGRGGESRGRGFRETPGGQRGGTDEESRWRQEGKQRKGKERRKG